MKHIIDGYRWMWGAVRRWKGGPLWRRILLFALYVLRDVFGTGRRTALAAGTAVALAAAGLLLFEAAPLLETGGSGVAPGEPAEPHGPTERQGSGLRRIGPPTAGVTDDLELHTSGLVRFRGRWIRRSDLGAVLERSGVHQADVIVDGDTKVGVVDDVQRIMVDHDVRIAGFRMVARVELSRD